MAWCHQGSHLTAMMWLFSQIDIWFIAPNFNECKKKFVLCLPVVWVPSAQGQSDPHWVQPQGGLASLYGLHGPDRQSVGCPDGEGQKECFVHNGTWETYKLRWVCFYGRIVYLVTEDYATLHRLISASISRWMTFDPAELPILPGGKCCALALLNIIPKFPKEKHQFLSDLTSKSSISICSQGYKVFFENLASQKMAYVTNRLQKDERW